MFKLTFLVVASPMDGKNNRIVIENDDEAIEGEDSFPMFAEEDDETIEGEDISVLLNTDTKEELQCLKRAVDLGGTIFETEITTYEEMQNKIEQLESNGFSIVGDKNKLLNRRHPYSQN